MSHTLQRARSSAAQMPMTGRAMTFQATQRRAAPMRGGQSARPVALQRRVDGRAVDAARAQDACARRRRPRARARAARARSRWTWSPRATASRKDSSSTFFARGVNGRWSPAHAPRGGRGAGQRAAGRTCARTRSRTRVEVDARASRAPSASRSGVAAPDDPLDLVPRPRRGHAVRVAAAASPAASGSSRSAEQQVLGADRTRGRRSQRVGLRAPTTTARASSANRSNIRIRLRRRRPPPCLRWTACLVTPSAPPMSCHDHPCSRGLGHVERLEAFHQRPQRGDRAQPDGGVGAVHRLGRASSRPVQLMGVNIR